MTADPRVVRAVRTHLNLAAHHLEQAEAKAREAGLVRKSGTLRRLATEATEQLGDLST
jgi:hypothetical protein